MILTVAFAFAQIADATTYLLLPPGGEANPFVAALPVAVAIMAKMTMMTGILLAERYLRQYRDPILVTGIIAGSVGFGSNLAVVL